jgi:peptidyl-prolyl cis-trans isomerase B (cyclophilin B)
MSKGKMRRISALVVALFAVSTLVSFTSPAQATVKCTKVNVVASTPKTIVQPTKASNPLPKKLTFTTNCGVIEITLNPKAPLTITSIAALAKGKYFDGTFCHRLTTDGLYVLQCGDPTVSGSGSPTGWKGYKDENLPANGQNNYPEGIVAMANSGPGTNGSQMFFVYQNTTLGPNYTIWGKITKGLDIVKYVAAQKATSKGSDGKWYYASDGYPLQPVKLISAKVS